MTVLGVSVDVFIFRTHITQRCLSVSQVTPGDKPSRRSEFTQLGPFSIIYISFQITGNLVFWALRNTVL